MPLLHRKKKKKNSPARYQFTQASWWTVCDLPTTREPFTTWTQLVEVLFLGTPFGWDQHWSWILRISVSWPLRHYISSYTKNMTKKPHFGALCCFVHSPATSGRSDKGTKAAVEKEETWLGDGLNQGSIIAYPKDLTDSKQPKPHWVNPQFVQRFG